MHGLAIMAQRLLGEALRIAAGFGPLRPGVAITVEGYPVNFELLAALPELRGAVPGPNPREVGEEGAFAGQIFEEAACVPAQVDQNGDPGFLAEETEGVVFPVNVLASEQRQVALAGAQVPAELIKNLPFRVGFCGQDGGVFGGRDGALFFVDDGGPLPAGDHRSRQPTHVEGKIV